MSRLAGGNALGRTDSLASSNYLCTNSLQPSVQIARGAVGGQVSSGSGEAPGSPRGLDPRWFPGAVAFGGRFPADAVGGGELDLDHDVFDVRREVLLNTPSRRTRILRREGLTRLLGMNKTDVELGHRVESVIEALVWLEDRPIGAVPRETPCLPRGVQRYPPGPPDAHSTSHRPLRRRAPAVGRSCVPRR
jgi:hypothetical protein